MKCDYESGCILDAEIEVHTLTDEWIPVCEEHFWELVRSKLGGSLEVRGHWR